MAAGTPDYMRVAVITTFYPNPAEPVRAVFVRNLIAAMKDKLNTVVIAPVPIAPPVSRERKWRRLREIPLYERDGVAVVMHPRYLVLPKLEILSGFTYFLSIFRKLHLMVRTGQINLLHVHCVYPDGVGVALAARLLGIPYVVTAHGSDINVYAEKRALGWQIKWALQNASAIIGVSDALCRKIRCLAPQAAERVAHIPCAGVDSKVFFVGDAESARRELQMREDGAIAVFAGRLVPIKSVNTLIAAWQRVCARFDKDDPSCLIIIGDGPERKPLERMTVELGISGRVRFIGEVNQQQLALWLRASTVFCLPTRNEGTPNTIVEALASGRPVVASRVGGIPELIYEHQNGLMVEPGDEEALATTIDSVIARSWGANDIAAGVSEFSWESLARRNAEVLRDASRHFENESRS